MRSLLIGQSRKDRLRRVLRRMAVVIASLVLSLLLTYTAFRRWTLMTPPDDVGPDLPRSVSVERGDGGSRLVVGESWMAWREGIWRLHLSGDPRVMGHSHGLLAAGVNARMERHMRGLMEGYLTSSWRRWLMENAVRWRFRHLPDNLPPSRLVELAAFSRTVVDTDEFPERPFQRMVYYHALHDMTQRLDGSPLIGCTAFAAWGKKTVSGNLIVGRNFDFEGGTIFDEEKAVIAFRSPGKIPFVSVAWPGMMGVVTGVNAQRLYVSMNAARTDHPLRPGIPMAFLLREILETASDIKGALAVIKKRQVMVAEALLLADGKVPEAVVVELSPGELAVQRSSAGVIGVTNHFLDKRYKGDASNHQLKRYTTSEARQLRLGQLLRRFGGRIDPRTAALILRNRTALDDEPLALGNRNAVDALIATHGVVVDLGEMILWVSTGPHLLGPMVPVDLKPLFSLPVTSMEPVEPIPADPLLGTIEHKRFLLAQQDLARARELRGAGHLEPALDFARRAAQAEPESPDARLLLGDILWALKRTAEAREHYATFLKSHPPYRRDQERVKVLLEP